MTATRFISLCACLLTTLPVALHAASAPAPAPRWLVEPGAVRCGLVREGASNEGKSITFRFVPGSGTPQIYLVRKGARGVSWHGDAKVTFEPSGASFAGQATWVLAGSETRYWIESIDSDEATLRPIDLLGSSSGVVVEAQGKLVARFDLGGVEGGMTSLSKCLDARFRAWGLDPAEQATITKPARANLAEYVSDKDFPPIALERMRAGITAFVLLVGRDGKVQRCMLIYSSGFPDLDEQTCKLMTERPQFEPARDASGNAVPTVVSARFNWVQPERHAKVPPLH